MGALIALAARAVASVGGRSGATAIARRAALPIGAGIAGAGIGEAVFGGGGGGGAGGALGPRRRRRRRVLTSNDRSDIAFIVATLGAPAGKAFAMIVGKSSPGIWARNTV